MKTVEVIVTPDGQTKLETKGFAGPQCRDASKLLGAVWARLPRSDSRPSITRLQRKKTPDHSNKVSAVRAMHQETIE